MSAPAVSVVIPCYNLGRYLDEAVDSVLAQTLDDFEIVVVDDGSTDEGTRSLIAGYARPNTRVFRTENRGLPAARNFGVRQTTGRYLCMLDADDCLEPMYMEKSVATLEAEPAIAFVSHWVRAFGDEEFAWTPERCDFPTLLDMNTVNGAALLRRAAFDAVGGFDESLRDGCEDWELWIRLVDRGFHGRILPEVLFRYRKRADSMSRTMLERTGHPALYAQIVGRHRRTFAVHLPALVGRRDADAIHLRRQVEDLEIEHFAWTGPELARLRDQVASADRRLEKRQAALAADALVVRHQSDASEARAEVDRLNQVVSATVSKALEYHAEYSRAIDQVDDMRRSLSWRMTKPLRAAAGFLGRLVARVRP